MRCSQSGVGQPRSPPAPVEPKGQRDVFRTSPDSDAFDQFVKNQRDMFMFSQSHDKSKDYFGKDMTDLGSSIRDSDIFNDSKYGRDPFGMTRDGSPKSRDSFGMPSSRDIGVVPNTRDSFAVARQSFKKLDGDPDRRSSVASTLVSSQIFDISFIFLLKLVLPIC